jgi:protocatechuate 3,4-dioxygenase beta subunit
MRDKISLTRRGFLWTAATIISASRLLRAEDPCTLTAEQEEGPFYIGVERVRRDITEGRPGVPLRLRIAVLDAKACNPIENAAVDIWHCDAAGVYSGFTGAGGQDGGRGFGPPRGRGGRRGGPMDETRFLRGVQLTNKQGIAEFVTIYPGWYAGRTIHIHLKTHLGGDVAAEQYSGGHVSHTGQLFLPEDVTEQIAKMNPYVNHSGVHRTLHREDRIFLQQGGAQSIVKLERLQNGSNAAGFVATIAVAVNPSATPRVF